MGSSTATTSKSSFPSNNTMSNINYGEVSSYSDPLITLLHSSKLNKDKELSNTLYEYIDDITDIELKKWCIDSLTTLRDLEKIETQLDQWEFHTLDFTLEVNNDSNINNTKLRTRLGNRVLKKSILLREQLSQQKDKINLTVDRSKKLSKNNPAKVITDAGTILIELTMRIVKLGKALDEQVTIGYSRAKLTLIGSELKQLVDLDNAIIDHEIVKNYTIFVNNLLNQLNNAVAHKDTVGLWESVAIIGDVEKMFDSMKQSTQTSVSQSKPNSSDSAKTDDDIQIDSPSLEQPNSTSSFHSAVEMVSGLSSESVLNTDSTLVNTEAPIENSTELPKLKTLTHLSAKEIFHDDNDLIRTKISDHLPELMQAFNKLSPQQQSANQKEQPKKVPVVVIPQSEKKIIETSKPTDKGEEADKGGYLSYFKPSLFGAFYHPQVREPIFVDPKSLPKELVNNENNTSKISENQAKKDLLEREREIRNTQTLLDSQLTNARNPAASTILQQLSKSVILNKNASKQ